MSNPSKISHSQGTGPSRGDYIALLGTLLVTSTLGFLLVGLLLRAS